MKKILFPTDYSEVSNNAFLHALKLADILQAEVITLHVFELPLFDINPVDMGIYNTFEILDTMDTINEGKNKEQVDYLCTQAKRFELSHVPLKHVCTQGYFLQQIIDYADEHEVDFIVMGTNGAVGLKEFFFGSSTFQVMTHTKATLYGIPEDAPYIPITKVGFATQFSIEELDTLRKLLNVTQTMGATIECVFVQTTHNQVSEVVIDDWRTIFKNDPINFNIINHEDIEVSIQKFLQEKNIQMLAMLNHKRGFWDSFFHNSLSEKLIHHLKIPVLALHNK